MSRASRPGPPRSAGRPRLTPSFSRWLRWSALVGVAVLLLVGAGSPVSGQAPPIPGPIPNPGDRLPPGTGQPAPRPPLERPDIPVGLRPLGRPPMQSEPGSWSFTTCGSTPTNWTVPAGIGMLGVNAQGGGGGTAIEGGYPGAGGLTMATLPVTPGEVLTIYVGCEGGYDGGKGWANGGRGGHATLSSAGDAHDGGGGGGATAILRGSTVLLVAGGGGGAGGGQGAGCNYNSGLGCGGGIGGNGGAGGNPAGSGTEGQATKGLGGDGGGGGAAGGTEGVQGQSGNPLYSMAGGGGGGGGYRGGEDGSRTELVPGGGGGGGGGLSYANGSALFSFAFATGYWGDGIVTLNTKLFQAFNCTGGPQQFAVPPGVSSLSIHASGAQGGSPDSAASGNGGLGGTVTATVPVSPGQLLSVLVGCDPGGGSQPGYGYGLGGHRGNGDSDLGKDGAPGGGGSAVQAPDGTLLVVAGGGGGGGGEFDFPGAPASGGDGGAGGERPTNGDSGNGSDGGSGGNGGSAAGPDGVHGEGADDLSDSGGGGGGGGGYRGGFGGEAGSTSSAGGGGGGGSSYVVSSATSQPFSTGTNQGNGIVILSWEVGSSAARVCPIGCPYTSIQAAINASTSGGSILIGPGIYTENVIIDKSLVISGEGEQFTTVDGGGRGTVVTVQAGATVTLENLTIYGGSAASGGGIRNFGALTLEGVSVVTNRATGDGAGISNQANARLTVTGSYIASNTGATIGAGIANQAGAQLTVQNSGVSGNQTGSQGNGGGIANVGGTVTILGSGIENNTAGGNGGAFHNAGGTMSVSGSIIQGNLADTGGGGGFHIAGGTVQVEHSGITRNGTGGHTGAGFMVVSGTLTVSQAAITYNGPGPGGGIYNQGGHVTIDHTDIAHNSEPQCYNVPNCG